MCSDKSCCSFQNDHEVLKHYEIKKRQLIQSCGTFEIGVLRQNLSQHEFNLMKIMSTSSGLDALKKLRELKDTRNKIAHPSVQTPRFNWFKKRNDASLESKAVHKRFSGHSRTESTVNTHRETSAFWYLLCSLVICFWYLLYSFVKRFSHLVFILACCFFRSCKHFFYLLWRDLKQMDQVKMRRTTPHTARGVDHYQKKDTC